MSGAYDEVLARNVTAYDAAVAERAAGETPAWKIAEHDAFVARLMAEGARSLVEIGAGTGFHARRFADAGLDVLATDPSPAMVAYCRSLGLAAARTDVLGLALPAPRDAAFAMSSLLHVPVADVPAALARVRENVRAGGLVYIGLYGGVDREGELAHDTYVPKRWFVSHGDARLVALAAAAFEIVDFHTVDVGLGEVHFQALTLRAPARRDAGVACSVDMSALTPDQVGALVDTATQMTDARLATAPPGPMHNMFSSIRNQLRYMRETIDAGRKPAIEDLNRLTLHVIAVREFETSDEAYCSALTKAAYHFKQLR